ncbi:DUF397 domain-containing protein [Streptomyces chrestomyceticus]|uniref:DUF397 domain-containing protein n=1 Tax=Streptomyces chrestomyceticus TaxID=68185 RepID=UPI0033C2E26F
MSRDLFQFTRPSYSGGKPGQECVEAATNVRAVVAVRDSKNSSGHTLIFGAR